MGGMRKALVDNAANQEYVSRPKNQIGLMDPPQ